jgi:hypothetical protein
MTTRRRDPDPAPTDDVVEVLAADPRSDCGFGPCPLSPCEYRNWGDQPVCRTHYVAFMATVVTDEPPREGETLDQTSSGG